MEPTNEFLAPRRIQESFRQFHRKMGRQRSETPHSRRDPLPRDGVTPTILHLPRVDEDGIRKTEQTTSLQTNGTPTMARPTT